jgi:hypothetical protein
MDIGLIIHNLYFIILFHGINCLLCIIFRICILNFITKYFKKIDRLSKKWKKKHKAVIIVRFGANSSNVEA